MSAKKTIAALLALCELAALLAGCAGAPAAQTAPDAPAQSAPQPDAKTDADSADADVPAAQSDEVGYRVGMRAPEFGMTLADGARATPASLADGGMPAFIYFHATW